VTTSIIFFEIVTGVSSVSSVGEFIRILLELKENKLISELFYFIPIFQDFKGNSRTNRSCYALRISAVSRVFGFCAMHLLKIFGLGLTRFSM